MSSIMISSSICVSVISRWFCGIKVNLGRLDQWLAVIAKFSKAGQIFRSNLFKCFLYCQRLSAGAKVLPAVRVAATHFAEEIALWFLVFGGEVYCGSVVLDVIGRAAENSRWIR